MSRADRALIGVALVCGTVALSREALPYSVWLTVVSVLFGGAITALFSWYFYKRAGDELRDETANLRHYTSVVLRVLEDAGYEVPRDPNTNVPLNRIHKDLHTGGLWLRATKEGSDEEGEARQ